MDLGDTIRRLRAEKRWFDEVIVSLEHFQRSKPFQAAALLDMHLTRNGSLNGSFPGRRRLTRWLRENGSGGSRIQVPRRPPAREARRKRAAPSLAERL